MLGKDKAKTSSYDIYVVGEQIRCQMLKVGLIKDRRYRFRKYRKCFVGRDVVDWLVKMCHAQSRGEAIMAMRCLQEHNMLHHVVDDHIFKDEILFYRFTRDDDTYLVHSDLTAFYTGLDVFHKVKEGNIQREFYHRGHLYQEAFYGADLVDCLLTRDLMRDDVIRQCRELLEYDIIRHVTDDYHFADDRLMYQFHVDYNRPCLLSDVLHDSPPAAGASSLAVSARLSQHAPSEVSRSSDQRDSRDGSSVDNAAHRLTPSHSSVDSNSNSFLVPPHSAATSAADNDLDNDSDIMTTLSQLGGVTSSRVQVTMVRRVIKLQQDEVGYGFVLRGSSPCYVHTVDPLGPAAAAGLKEGQYVLSVNGESMKQSDHRQVGRHVMCHTGLLTLVVLSRTTTPSF